jgi:peptide deformylase
MPILKIITNPNQLLRKKSEKINLREIGSKKFKKFCSAMVETMIKKDGIGLAAPQVGKNIRLIVINTKEEKIIMVNPEILKRSILKEWKEEGCLSVPDIFGLVKRSKKITCLYYDSAGIKKKIKGEGLLARVIQHEVDHLDGILFIDKAKEIKKITSEKFEFENGKQN